MKNDDFIVLIALKKINLVKFLKSDGGGLNYQFKEATKPQSQPRTNCVLKYDQTVIRLVF